MLEGLWSIAFVYTLLRMRDEIRKIEWNDPQVRALRDFGPGAELLHNQEHKQALVYFTKQIHAKCNSMDVAYWLRATARLGLHQYELAIEDCEQGIARNLYLTGTYRIRGLAYYALADWDRALENLEYAARLGDVHPEVYALRADILYRKGQTLLAQKAQEKANQLLVKNT